MPYLFAALLSITALLFVQDPQDPAGRDQMPDLVGALQKTEGCLGVETARTSSGKQAIFAWFEDKKAVLGWYYGPVHQQVMGAFKSQDLKEPLEHVEDGTGPILVIASLTMSDRPHFEDLSLPVSQIAIELYQPLPGGSFLGARFTPEAVPVPHSRDYTKEKGGR